MIIRDERTKALINTDAESFHKYKRERDQAKKVEMLSAELKEIKERLTEVLQRLEKIA
jgi:hypothetical protein